MFLIHHFPKDLDNLLIYNIIQLSKSKIIQNLVELYFQHVLLYEFLHIQDTLVNCILYKEIKYYYTGFYKNVIDVILHDIYILKVVLLKFHNN